MSAAKGGRGLGSITMIYTAFLLLAFLVVHVATLKYGVGSGIGAENLFGRVMGFFKCPWCAGFYVLCLAGLGLHLSHGVQSAFQTLGLNHFLGGAR